VLRERLWRASFRADSLSRQSTNLRGKATSARIRSRPRGHYAKIVGTLNGLPVVGLVRSGGFVDGDQALVIRSRHASPPVPGAGFAAGVDARLIDPLVTTLELARACDAVWSVELFDAGARSSEGRVGVPRSTIMRREDLEPPGWFSCEVVHAGDSHIVSLVGELDIAAGPRLRDALMEIGDSEVVVDVSRLTFIDASGLSALLEARRRIHENGHGFRLTGAQGIVRRVFDVTELSHLLSD